MSAMLPQAVADSASSRAPSAPGIGLLRRKEPLGREVRDPHDRGHVPIVIRLLFCVLVAGPDKVLLGRKGLSLLFNPKLSFGDMADHGILHRGTHGLGSRLHY